MAKWGEGDPRWIVEERPDATNVNNWHWTEKNADEWSKNKIRELFNNVDIVDDKLKVKLEKVEKIEGEARANNRKAKLIFFYEWDLRISWQCPIDDKVVVKGDINIPNLSEEHTDMRDVDIEVDVTENKNAKEATTIKESLRKGKGANAIRQLLEKYVQALKSEFSVGLILPKKNNTSDKKEKSNEKRKEEEEKAKRTKEDFKAGSAAMKKLEIGKNNTFTKLSLCENFKCTSLELYNALTQPEMMRVFSGSEVTLDEKKNFKMLHGNIEGQFVQLEPSSLIIQKWRLKDWKPSDHFSTVELRITQLEDSTELQLEQSGVPERALENTKEGWKRYYFQAIKRAFGFGAILF